jgi:long-chain acyl-CoA synthetase
MTSRTLYKMFCETAAVHATKNAVGFHAPRSEEIQYWSYAELQARISAVRRAMDAAGLRKGDCVSIFSENCAEWILFDMAAHAAGIMVSSPYASLPANQAGYIVRDCGAKLLVCSDHKQAARALEFWDTCPALKIVVQLNGELKANRDGLVTLSDFLKMGESGGRSLSELDKEAESVDAQETALLIYTSGTTGEPKGAMLTHANVLQTPDGVVREHVADIGSQDVFLSFLPLSHITERVGGYYLPIRVGACIVFSNGLSEVGKELTEIVRPTCMLCVPRIFENIHSKYVEGLPKMDPKMRSKVVWAINTGTEFARSKSDGTRAGLLLTIKYRIAEKLILPRVREKLTGGNIRFFVSGGAPLNLETATFFLGIGIQILEGYGLSETNIIAINRPGKQRIGTVGQIMPDVELKIAEDGEILMRGTGCMRGYYRQQEATAAAIDVDRWFHTGDIGELSADGYLKITDRKKDIIVLTNGKKVAPQPIEAQLKLRPFIAEAVLFGDKQSTVMALIVPEFGRLMDWAKQNDLSTKDVAALADSPEFQKVIKAEIDAVNNTLADYEKVRKYRVLSMPFTIESGELTPTLKVKRGAVAAKYADLLAGMSR